MELVCEYCSSPGFKLHCGHLACAEHAYPVRLGSRIIHICIDCYEKAKLDLESSCQPPTEKDWATQPETC